jgi:hypothetical protein
MHCEGRHATATGDDPIRRGGKVLEVLDQVPEQRTDAGVLRRRRFFQIVF